MTARLLPRRLLAALAHLAKGCKVISKLPIALQGDRERQSDEEPDTENEN